MNQIMILKSPILAVVTIAISSIFFVLSYTYMNYTEAVLDKITEIESIESNYNSRLLIEQIDKLYGKVDELGINKQSRQDVLNSALTFLDSLLDDYTIAVDEERPRDSGAILSIPVTLVRNFDNAGEFISFLTAMVENEHPHIEVNSVSIVEDVAGATNRATIKMTLNDAYIGGN